MIVHNLLILFCAVYLVECQIGLLSDNSPLGFLGDLISPNKNRETTTINYGGGIDLAGIWGENANTGNIGNFGGGNRGRGSLKPKPKPTVNKSPINYFNIDNSESLEDRFRGIIDNSDNDAFLSNPFNNNNANKDFYDNFNNRPNKGGVNKETGNKGNNANSGNNRPWINGNNQNQKDQLTTNMNEGNNGNNWGGNNKGGTRPNNKDNGNNGNNKGNKGNNSNKNKDKFTTPIGNLERDDFITPSKTTLTPVIPSPTTSKTTTPASDPEECLETVTMVRGKPACSGELIFKDNFGYLNRDKWDPEIRFAGSPDYEFVVYVNDTENLHIADKKLCIKPTLLDDKYGEGYTLDTEYFDLGEGCTGQKGSTDCIQRPQAFIILPPVETARINTKDHFVFLYGTVEIRAKLPKGDWIYPELFLTPTISSYGPDYNSGSIRIAFLPGNANISTTLSGGCILGSSKAARTYAMKSITSNRSWTDTYHKFTIKWKPESITVYVDDEVYGKVVAPEGGFAIDAENLNVQNAGEWQKGTSFAPFDKEMYLTIGVGVGGQCFEDQDGKPYRNRDPKAQRRFYDARETWKQTWNAESVLQVDYVNVIAL